MIVTDDINRHSNEHEIKKIGERNVQWMTVENSAISKTNNLIYGTTD
jgi:hypothetical protein